MAVVKAVGSAPLPEAATVVAEPEAAAELLAEVLAAAAAAEQVEVACVEVGEE